MAQSTAAEQHQSGQAALASLVPSAVATVWPLLDPHDLSGTTPAFTVAVQAIVHRYGQAAAAAALDFYRRQRAEAGVKARMPSLRIGSTPDAAPTVRYVASGLYGAVTPDSLSAAQTVLQGSVEGLVLQQSRETVLDAVRRDRSAKGWARVTEAGACSFCTMLALRAGVGFLYRSERSGNFRAHMPHLKSGSIVGGVCRCHVEPVFNAYEPPAYLREAQGLWAQSTKGRFGADARNAFRRAWDSRPQDA